MKLIKDYEVEGCWGIPNNPNECRLCGTRLELVPKKGHFNSKFWTLKRDDGLKLLCCPKGCSVKDADYKFKWRGIVLPIEKIKKTEVIYLKISNFRFSFDGEHYYGKLSNHHDAEYKRIELERKLSQRQATYLNKKRWNCFWI